jgi:hypothetical protein
MSIEERELFHGNHAAQFRTRTNIPRRLLAISFSEFRDQIGGSIRDDGLNRCLKRIAKIGEQTVVTNGKLGAVFRSQMFGEPIFSSR